MWEYLALDFPYQPTSAYMHFQQNLAVTLYLISALSSHGKTNFYVIGNKESRVLQDSTLERFSYAAVKWNFYDIIKAAISQFY